MDERISDALDGLGKAGWTIDLETKPRGLPRRICERYANPPPLFAEFASGVRSCVRDDEQAWFLTAAEYSRTPLPDGFAWNEFETMMTADGDGRDAGQLAHIENFWTRHLPILQAVDGDYEYLAIDMEAGTIVHALVVDFEATSVVADDFADFLRRLGRIGRARPTRELVGAEDLALLVHAKIIEDGGRPEATPIRRLMTRLFGTR